MAVKRSLQMAQGVLVAAKEQGESPEVHRRSAEKGCLASAAIVPRVRFGEVINRCCPFLVT